MPTSVESVHALADAATIVRPDARLVTRQRPARHVLDLPIWEWNLFRGRRCIAYASGMATAVAAREHALRWAPLLISDDER